jgi:hypothetical protein
MIHRGFDIDLVRGVQRRFGFAKSRSSYPFISGDTYAGLCDFIFSKTNLLSEIDPSKIPSKIFLPASLKEDFLFELKKTRLDFAGSMLVIHNYDNIPSEIEMQFIATRFKRVYSVNWLGDRDKAVPIPIGLENWQLLRNGVPRDFQKSINKGLQQRSDRAIQILSSFSLQTNLVERRKAVEFSLSCKDVHHMASFTSPREYREMVSRSQFVLSPPGNGADCHRTWEAIYLGATPIVHRDFWPFNHLELPVVVVDDWFDIPKMIQKSTQCRTVTVEELSRIFLTID